MAEQQGLGAAGAAQHAVKWIDDKRLVKPSQLSTLKNWIQDAPILVVDYEGDGLDTRRGARTFMAGFNARGVGPKVVDFRLTGSGGIQAVSDGLSARTGTTIVHNAKHEIQHSWALGFNLGGVLFDNQAAFFAWDERLKSHGQKELVTDILKRDTPHARTLHTWMQLNLGTHERGHELNPAELEIPYNCEDIQDALDLYEWIQPKIQKLGMSELVRVDSEMLRCVSNMEVRGIQFDLEHAHDTEMEFKAALDKSYAEIRSLLNGRQLDVGSHTQLVGLIFGQLGLPQHKDLEKAGSLDSVVLQWLMTLPEVTSNPHTQRLLECIQDHREYQKLQDYILSWQYEHQINGALHPNLNSCIAGTRRFTGSNPNLQNVPKGGKLRGERGKLSKKLAMKLRKCFICRPGFITYSSDYSQVEYRTFVHYGKNPTLIRGYKEDVNFDIHLKIAQLITELGYMIDRDGGKTLNFGILFGMGIEKLSRSLLCSKETAKKILEAYGKISGAKDLKAACEREVKMRGCVTDLFMGRRHLEPDEAYKSLNTKCQMTAADLIRRAMERVAPTVWEAQGNMLLQIHDDLLYELPGTDVEAHRPVVMEVERIMNNNPEFLVPICVETDYFDTNWAEKKKLPWKVKQ